MREMGRCGYVFFCWAVLSLLTIPQANALDGWLQLPKRNRYLIPEGYAGWLCLSHAVPEAPELPMADGFRLVEFPPSGVVVTRSEGMPGKYFDEYFFIAENGQTRPVGEQELGGGYTEAQTATPERYTFKFWVSSDVLRDYSLFVDNKSRECAPFPGYSIP